MKLFSDAKIFLHRFDFMKKPPVRIGGFEYSEVNSLPESGAAMLRPADRRSRRG